MVELFANDNRTQGRMSSKGNQLKWMSNDYWYKSDYTGYEGLAEYMVSGLLRHSNLAEEKFIHYDTEEIFYEGRCYLGCRSRNFLPPGWQLITLERLFMSYYGESLHKSVYTIRNLDERVRFLVEQVVRLTGLEEFGKYMSILLTIDAFFLNEDRHMHNIAVLLDEEGKYHYCPVFDNGAALLADTTLDYPLEGDVESLMKKARPKTFCSDFEEQLDAVERLYGMHFQFDFGWKEVDMLLQAENYYPENAKKRVEKILTEQRLTYRYLFE